MMMSESSGPKWQNLPVLVFSDIMMKIGSESLDNIQKSRQVCKSWNEMILGMTKHQEDKLRRKAAERIRAKFSDNLFVPSLKLIFKAKSYVESGHLQKEEIDRAVKRLKLYIKNLKVVRSARKYALLHMNDSEWALMEEQIMADSLQYNTKINLSDCLFLQKAFKKNKMPDPIQGVWTTEVYLKAR